jgi:uncharacterized protein (DUF2267 family)
MDAATFIEAVATRAGISSSLAERAVHATLETLGERVSDGVARDVARHLPRELRPVLEQPGNAQRFDLDEFLRRVGEREGTNVVSAERHVRAVFAVLRLTVAADDFRDLLAELPNEFVRLFEPLEAPRAGPGPLISAEGFAKRVATRTGLDPESAREVTDVVLEALAERISGGEVDDLAAELPEDLLPPLDRGKAKSHGAARPIPADEFVEKVAETEGVDPQVARDHAAAVLATLRETVSQKELFDVVSQLSHDYIPLFARA